MFKRIKKIDRIKDIMNFRKNISDIRLKAFFRCLNNEFNDNITSVELIKENLNDNKSFHEIFCAGDKDDFVLAVQKKSDVAYEINFGYCSKKFLIGDGGIWSVKFSGDDVKYLQMIDRWVS